LKNKKDSPLDQYFEDIADSIGLSTADEYSLYVRIKQGDRLARDTLVQSNLRFVVQVARRYERSGVPLEDLISAGNYGLIRAAEKFDATHNYRFITYAVRSIRNQIQITIIEQRNVVRIPQNQTAAIYRAHRLRDELEQRHARNVRLDVAAEASDMELGVATDVIRSERAPASMDSPRSPTSDLTFHDTIASSSRIADSMSVEARLRELLSSALVQLTPRQRRIVSSYFGIDGRGASTLAELGMAEGLTRERVRQIKDQALIALRRAAPFGLSPKTCTIRNDRNWALF